MFTAISRWRCHQYGSKWYSTRTTFHSNIKLQRRESDIWVRPFNQRHYSQLYSATNNLARWASSLASLPLLEGAQRTHEWQYSLASFQSLKCSGHVQQFWKTHSIFGWVLAWSCTPSITRSTEEVFTDIGLLGKPGRRQGVIWSYFRVHKAWSAEENDGSNSAIGRLFQQTNESDPSSTIRSRAARRTRHQYEWTE